MRSYTLADNQRGKVIVLALFVSLIVAWQTLHILETGWYERRLLNQQHISVQARQSVLSISSAVMSWLHSPEHMDVALENLENGELIELCFDSEGILTSFCNQDYLGLFSAKSSIEATDALYDLSGDNWIYTMIESIVRSELSSYAERVLIAVQTDTGQIRIQQRYWLDDGSY